MTYGTALDPARLDTALRARLPGLEGPIRIERIAGGQSNPTFFVSYDNRRMVLRKQPDGALLPSAHAIDREFRVMQALADTGVPVPGMLAWCDDASVIGTPFYVMERVAGRVFADCSLTGVDGADRHAMFMSMADTLARLHSVHWATVGLVDFGKQGDYFARQVKRWTRQWELSKSRPLPDIERLAEWLPAHLPPDTVTAISHGDFRIGNLMFHPREPRVVAVLDWELSTLGHPLADLAYSALAWHLKPTEYMGMKGRPLEALGIPGEEAYLARYYAGAPSAGRVQPFHYAFALFRLAVIFEGIAARARSGHAASANAAETGKLSTDFARIAVRFIETENIA
ncbi:MAG: phosphotransferase family protein [Variovorax sp.]